MMNINFLCCIVFIEHGPLVRPSDPEEEKRPDRTLDWITFRFFHPSSRVLAAYVKNVRGGQRQRDSCYSSDVKQKNSLQLPPLESTTSDKDTTSDIMMNLYPPSDHKPVISVFEIYESCSSCPL